MAQLFFFLTLMIACHGFKETMPGTFVLAPVEKVRVIILSYYYFYWFNLNFILSLEMTTKQLLIPEM